MTKKIKSRFFTVLTIILVFQLTGCAKLGSIINDIHGSLVGNNYTIYTYDNYGSQTLKTTGKKISITGNKIETTSYDSNGKAVTGIDEAAEGEQLRIHVTDGVYTAVVEGRERIKRG